MGLSAVRTAAAGSCGVLPVARCRMALYHATHAFPFAVFWMALPSTPGAMGRKYTSVPLGGTEKSVIVVSSSEPPYTNVHPAKSVRRAAVVEARKSVPARSVVLPATMVLEVSNARETSGSA